jgi:hypothetical protein
MCRAALAVRRPRVGRRRVPCCPQRPNLQRHRLGRIHLNPRRTEQDGASAWAFHPPLRRGDGAPPTRRAMLQLPREIFPRTHQVVLNVGDLLYGGGRKRLPHGGQR